MDDITVRVIGTAEIPLDLPLCLTEAEGMTLDTITAEEFTRTCPLFEVTLHPTKQLHPQNTYDPDSAVMQSTYSELLEGKKFLMIQSSVDCFSGRRPKDSGMHTLTTGEPFAYTVEGYRLINGLTGGQGREAESLDITQCSKVVRASGILDEAKPAAKDTNVRRIGKSVRSLEYPKDWYQYEQFLAVQGPQAEDGASARMQVQGLTMTTLGMRTDRIKPSKGWMSMYISSAPYHLFPAGDMSVEQSEEGDELAKELSKMGWIPASGWQRAAASDVPAYTGDSESVY